MIITRLMGGLGNQMFQYAAARRLASKNGAILKLDISYYREDPLRNYELHNFSICAEIATDEECERFKKAKRRSSNALRKILLLPYWFREKHFHFDPRVLELGDNVYLDGYWQSEKYFSDYVGEIRKDFEIKPAPSPENVRLLNEIKAVEAVGAHVRRGDYVTSSLTHQYHGTCSLDYYKRAASIVADRVNQPRFYVFSDDPGWVIENLDLGCPAQFLNINDPQAACEDFRLMKSCKHFILANSSFSWWAAWLCEKTEKVVIAPKQWFREPNIDTDDLIPGSWLRISSS